MSCQKQIQLSAVAICGALAVTVAGCGKEAEKKARQLATEKAALVSENNALKARLLVLEPLEGELDRMKQEFEGAKNAVAKFKEQEAIVEVQQKIVKRLLDRLKDVIDAGDLTVRLRRGRMVVALPSAVLFKSGKADLSGKGKKTLDKVSEVLKEISDRNFQVAGHTDNVRVSEGNPYGTNWHLSTARAISVVLYLKEAGIRPKRLSAAGYAQFQPLASNKSKRGKARNRRIEITLMPNLSELPNLSRIEKKLGLSETE